MSNRTKPKRGRYTPPPTALQRQVKSGTAASDLADCLDAVADLAELRQEVEGNLVGAVAAARAAGATWTVLGTQLGVSRQSAQERYGKTSPPKGDTVFEVRVVRT